MREIGNFRIFLHEFPRGWGIYTKTWEGERIPGAVARGRDVQRRLWVARDREVREKSYVIDWQCETCVKSFCPMLYLAMHF